MYKIALLLSLLSSSAMAELLSCEALLQRVDTKLQAKGVPSYTLEFETISNTDTSAVPASGVSISKSRKGKEVGTCNGSTKRLIYIKSE